MNVEEVTTEYPKEKNLPLLENLLYPRQEPKFFTYIN